jgi:cytochrome c551/c552
MSSVTRFFWTVVAVAGMRMVGLQAAQSQPAAPIDRSVLDQYCVTCHNTKLKTAGLSLDTIDLAQVAANAEALEKVARKLRSGQMPPAGRPRPDQPRLHQFVTAVEDALDRAAASSANPGRIAVRRLNRLEYVNAVHDLLALDIDPGLLPADNLGVGFDNNANILSVTPSLMQRYMSAASRVSRLALGDPAIRPTVLVYKAPAFAQQDVRMSEDLPFGTHGGLAVRHVFPLDAEYVFKVRLQRNSGADTIRGMDNEVQVELNIDHTLVKRFSVGGRYKGFDPALANAIPEDDIEGRERHDYRLTADHHMEVRIPIAAGPRVVSVAFTDAAAMIPERVPMAPSSLKTRFHWDDAGDPGIDYVEISGPYAATVPKTTPSRQRIFACQPTRERDVESCARTILTTLAQRAYRRPVGSADVEELMRLFKAGNQQGGFEAGIGIALETLLSSPAFLFRLERDPADARPGTVYRVSDLELASRLSFALWKSIPDEELLQVAAQGRLHEPPVRAQQVRRMLADPKAKRWMDDFMAQWLTVRSLQGHEPDPGLFPEFDDTLRQAMLKETELFFESQVRNDTSVLDLLRADYTFLNEQLARHYGVPDVYGSHFRRVPVTDPARKGLLGHASILTVTSYADRTSVVLRGKWVLDTLLGAPPPPPPPDVPALEQNKPGATPRSLRERMEQHRKNSVCASCHAAMDPFGFALENFSATGRWRDTDGGAPIDPASKTPDGTTIDAPAGFRTYLMGRGDEFVRTLTARLLEYFLGRSLEYYDGPALRQIVRDAAADNHRWSSLILRIVESGPFQMRTSVPRDERPVAASVAGLR